MSERINLEVYQAEFMNFYFRCWSAIVEQRRIHSTTKRKSVNGAKNFPIRSYKTYHRRRDREEQREYMERMTDTKKVEKTVFNLTWKFINDNFYVT
jgi:hypothetical protein